MNKATYKTIEKAHKTLENLFDSFGLDLDELEARLDEGNNDWNDKSERWRESEAGQEEEDRLNELESAIVNVKALYDARNRVVEQLETILNDAPEGSLS